MTRLQEQAIARACAHENLLGELLAATKKHLQALDAEARANLTLANAEANFSDSLPEQRKSFAAMAAASKAAEELRAVIAKAEAVEVQ